MGLFFMCVLFFVEKFNHQVLRFTDRRSSISAL